MSVVQKLVRALTLRDLSDQIEESKRRINEAEEKVRAAPPEKKEKLREALTSGVYASILCLTLVSCAAPASDQGQGGSTGATPLVVINIGTGGGVNTTNTSVPTAAPASSASAAQTATNEVKPAVGTDAIEAATGAGAVKGAVKTLTGSGEVKVPPVPETPAPAVPE